MDLFVVNRYYGDESSSKFLLEKPSSSGHEEEVASPVEPETSKTKKKKKKDRDNDLTFETSSCSQDIESTCDSVPSSSKKKKSKRRKNEDDQENEVTQEYSVLENRHTRSVSEENVQTTIKSKRDSTSNEPEKATGDQDNCKKKKRKSNSNKTQSDENIGEDFSNLVESECFEKLKSKRKSAKNDLIVESDNVLENETPSKKKKIIETLDPSTNILPREDENNEITEVFSNKKKKRKSEAIATLDKSSVDENASNKNIKEDSSLLDNKSEVNSTKSKIEETPNSKKKKRESEKPSTSANNKEPLDEENENSIIKKKTKSQEVSQESKKVTSKTKSSSNQTAVNSEVSKGGSKPDETTKKRKPKVRARGRYKNRPKTNDTQKENESKKEKETEDKENSGEETDDGQDKENSGDLGGFQVIGNLEFHRKKKVKRVLPDWLAKPTVISVNLQNLKRKVEDLAELYPHFKKQLRKNGVTHFFPVQSELVPFLIKQHSRRTMFWPGDVCVSAPTGSGKTLAFVLPILQLLQYRVVPRIRALVVLPTQDLASQVYSVFKTYAKGTKLQVGLTVGSSPIQEEQKKLVMWDIIKEKYVSLVDIVVTTPGRLVDHLTNSLGFDLSALKFLVVDEADRMIDNNDCNWLLHINKHINHQGLNSAPPLSLHTFLTYPSRPQRLLFSATLSHDPEKLHQLGLFQPKLFTSVVDATGDIPAVDQEISGFIGKFTTPAELSEKLTVTRAILKPLVVYQLIKKHAWKGVLCFVNTAQGAHRLARLLYLMEKVASKNDDSPQLNIAEVYSDLKFEQRNKIIQDFRQRKIHLVVASDNLARGIDVENIDVVINYEAPDNIKKYIHRIGRTARGGRQGTSVTLVTTHERNAFLKMLAGVGKQNVEDLECTEEELEKLEEVYAKALEKLKKDIEREGEMTLKIAKAQKKGKIFKKKPMLLDGTSNKTSKIKSPRRKNNTDSKKTTNTEGSKENKTENISAQTKHNKSDRENVTAQKTVKRNQIKKVVKKNWKPADRLNKSVDNKNKLKKKGAQNAKKVSNNAGMKAKNKRNLKIKMKKQLKKKLAQNQINVVSKP